MIEIKKFKCGLCKVNQQYFTTRKGLRDHLKEEHKIKNEVTNRKSKLDEKGGKIYKQSWWLEYG